MSKKVAVLVEENYQDMEVWYPVLRLREAGYEVVIVGTTRKEYKGKYGYPVQADRLMGEVKASEFDGVVIPGGFVPDRLRLYPEINELVRRIFEDKKTVAAICHGGWVLVSARVLKGRNVTGYIAIKDDLENAGARYSDAGVVIDDNLITSRKPEDLPDFMKAVINSLEKFEVEEII